MKFKSVAAAGALLFAFAASHAKADFLCSLSVSSWYVPIGQSYSYGVDISPPLFGVVPPPPYNQPAPFTVVFYGSKDGVDDIPAGGETYPATFGYGHSDLTGYYNPGGFTGFYQRYAKIYASYGGLYCVTNTVDVLLQ